MVLALVLFLLIVQRLYRMCACPCIVYYESERQDAITQTCHRLAREQQGIESAVEQEHLEFQSNESLRCPTYLLMCFDRCLESYDLCDLDKSLGTW